MTMAPPPNATDAVLDLRIRVSEREPEVYDVFVTSPVGEASGRMKLSLGEMQRLTDGLRTEVQRGGRRSRAGEAASRDYGATLFNGLLADQALECYRRTRELARSQGSQTRISLSLEPPQLTSLAWEFLFDADRSEFVSADIPIVRYFDLPQPIRRAPVAGPVRVLGIVPSPEDLPAVDVTRERLLVDEATRDAVADGLVQLTWLDRPTLEQLRRHLQGGPWHAIHYVGVAGVNRSFEEAEIIFEDDSGRADLISASRLSALLRDVDDLRLVMLSIATGAGVSDGAALARTAASLVVGGVAAVVADQFQSTDETRLAFLRGFYRAVAQGTPVDVATQLGRNQIRATTASFEWGVPALYVRTFGRLFERADSPSPTAQVPPMVPAGVMTDEPIYIRGEETVARIVEYLRSAASGERNEPAVVLITGEFGSGKTSTALRVANMASSAFPDGDALVAVEPDADAARALASALEGPLRRFAGNIETGGSARDLQSAYVRAMSGRKAIVVLDGVSDPEIAMRFRPPDPGTALIVTSPARFDLPNALSIALEAPTREEIDQFVERLANRTGATLPEDAVAELAGLQPDEIVKRLGDLAAETGVAIEGLAPPVASPETEPPAQTTTPSPATPTEVPSQYRRSGFSSDIVPTVGPLPDHLRMEQEVEALSWITSARDVEPPLSIGLFGAWGTGKSTFMALMQRRITAISEESRTTRAGGVEHPACEYVRQITFNAWHYADANLWASLVTHIFEELAKPGGKEVQNEEYRNLVGRLETTRALREAAQDRKALAVQERERRIEQLDGVRRDRAETAKALGGGFDPTLAVRDAELRITAARAPDVVGVDAAKRRGPSAETVTTWLGTVLTDPDLVRRAVAVIPDEPTRERLLAILGREDVGAVLKSAAEGRIDRIELAKALANPASLDDAAGLVGDPQTREQLAALGTGIKAAYDDALALGEIATDLQTIKGRLTYLAGYVRESLRSHRLSAILGLGAVGLLIAGVAFALVLNSGSVVTWLSSGLGLLGAAGAVIRVAREPIRKIREAVEFAVDTVQVRARRQIDVLKVQEQGLEREIEQATHDEHEAERELEDIRQGRRLYRYIEERARATDYKPYLGIIAQIRKDFTELARLMDDGRVARDDAFKARANPQPAQHDNAGADDADEGADDETETAATEEELPSIDRVILYIDDLDRCPVDRVVQVLEAVHLLLALKLFVVVVGVDPRWLMRSLRNHYSAQLSPTGNPLSSWEGDRQYWESTPENYLEKIFQVPFSLRPMNPTGYKALMADVLRVTETHATTSATNGAASSSSASAAGSKGAEPGPQAVSQTSVAHALAGTSPEPVGTSTEAGGADAATAGGQAESRPTEGVGTANAALGQDGDGAQPKAGTGDKASTPGASAQTVIPPPRVAPPPPLAITADELAFVQSLSAFVPTPRSAKRLANTYRLIRVMPSPEIAHVKADPEAAYKVPLILLAILIGFSAQAGELFRELLEAKEKTWSTFIKRLTTAQIAELRSRSGAASPSTAKRDGSRTAAQASDAGARPRTPEPESEEIRDWERLSASLAEIGPLPSPLAAYRGWAYLVGRFSFEIGRVTAAAEADDRGTSRGPAGNR